jgi:hypothetical protein
MTTDRNDFADHTFSTLPPGYRGWALPCKDDPAAVWVWLSPEEMTGLTPEEAAHKAEFTLGDDRIFMAQHRACKDAWKHYEAAKPRAPAGSIATRLRAAADDLTFSGRPDPHDDKALLREAAAVLDSPDLRLLKDANAEWQEFGQWLVTTFQPGAVEPAAVLCPGGEYESGAAFCRRVLQMALERGAFHWASPTPLWHERQDGKRPDKSGGLAENLDACAVAVQALAIREDGKIDPETIVGTVRAEAVDTRFLELFYLSGPRVGLRFEGLPDLYVPDADAHAIAATLLAGGEPAAPSWKLITRAAEYFGQWIHVDGVAGKLVLTDSGTYYKAGPGRSRAELAQDIRVAVARLRALTLLPEDARRVTEVAGQLEAFAAAMSPVREDTSPDTDPSPTGQARAEFFRALQDRGADRGPTSSEPEQDPAARLLPRPA